MTYALILTIQVLGGPPVERQHSQIFTDLKKCKAAARVVPNQPRVVKAKCRQVDPCKYIDDPRCHGYGDCGPERVDCPNFKMVIHDSTNCSGWCEK